jgi:LPS sulfotransferase NodH
MRNTRLAGWPEEYFWRDDEPFWRERWNVSSFVDYLDRAFEQGSTPNGVFGAKVMMGGGYFEHFVSNLVQLPQYKDQDIRVPDLISRTFPNLHHIWVTRRNKVRQAVSWWKAAQTWVWASTEDEPPDLGKAPEFKFEAIDHLVQEVVLREASWQEYFAACGISPFVVVYEDLVSAYEDTALQALDYLGIPVPPDLVFGERKLKKQADELSEEWVMRYRDIKQADLPTNQWEFVAGALG